jgi:mono/diheme cytochrome c family protein
LRVRRIPLAALRALALFGALSAADGCGREVAGGRADGAEIYLEVCARCHGRDGIPDSSMIARLGVKPLTSEHVQEMSDALIRHQILAGSDNKQMPSFEGALSDDQVDALVRHIRELAAAGARAGTAPR